MCHIQQRVIERTPNFITLILDPLGNTTQISFLYISHGHILWFFNYCVQHFLKTMMEKEQNKKTKTKLGCCQQSNTPHLIQMTSPKSPETRTHVRLHDKGQLPSQMSPQRTANDQWR